MTYKSLKSLQADVIRWSNRLPRDIDIIVGVPRSGLLAANLLALHRNMPVTTLDSYLKGIPPEGGQRCPKTTESQGLHVLILEDSVSQGTSILAVKERVRKASKRDHISYGAVYVIPGTEHLVDVYAQCMEPPRIFEWNLRHHALLERFCLDIDGVLCEDPAPGVDDDGKQYRQFLENACPLFSTDYPIGWLVTSRLEKYRAETSAWLSRHGFQYHNLIMLNLETKSDRDRISTAEFKAYAYLHTDALLFVESSRAIAPEIARLSGRPVLCTETMEMAG